MKNNNDMKTRFSGMRPFASLAVAFFLLAGMTACTADLISQPVGEMPDEMALGHVGSALRSGQSFTGFGQVVLAEPVEGEEPRTVVADEIYYEFSKPATTDTKVTLSVGTELTPEFLAEVDRQNERIKAYNKYIMWNYPAAQEKLFGAALLPAQNIRLESENLTVPVGKTISETVKVSVSNVGLSRDSLYLLPLIVEQAGMTESPHREPVQYLLQVQSEDYPWSAPTVPPGSTFSPDPNFFTVFYVNTETYQPAVVGTYGYTKTIRNPKPIRREKFMIGNIVNLRPAFLGVNAGAAILSLGPDLRYVLEHREKYIVPTQQDGRKVCVCIQGGGKGLGFCNLSDTQIADFTAQVKKVVYDYNLDGVNLWDEGSKYGKEGMPPVNTTSYPKLIKALREAMPGKLLTLVDKDEPTAHFDDVAACGGIEVGKYIDYAWSGYCNEAERVQIIEPWASDHPFSEHTRKPIAGLSPERYGSINLPLYSSKLPRAERDSVRRRMVDWRDSGRMRNKMVVFGFDLTSNEQGPYEGCIRLDISYLSSLIEDGSYWGQNPWTHQWGFQPGNVVVSYTATTEIAQVGYKYLFKDW